MKIFFESAMTQLNTYLSMDKNLQKSNKNVGWNYDLMT